MAYGKLREVRHLHREEENSARLEKFTNVLRGDGRSEHTVTAYRFAVKDFLDFICGLEVTEVSHREVREWLHWLHNQGCGASTLANRKYALRSFFTFLREYCGGKDSPTRHIPNRRVVKRLPLWLSVEKMRKLVAATDNPRDSALVEFMWSTGCRPCEIVCARLENISWDERIIKVLGKGQKERLLPLGHNAVKSVQAYLRAFPHIGETGFLFRRHLPAQNGGHSTPTRAQLGCLLARESHFAGRHNKARASRQKHWNDGRAEADRPEAQRSDHSSRRSA